MASRRRSMFRSVLTRVVVLLLLGAAVNVAVAWGCAYKPVDYFLYYSKLRHFQTWPTIESIDREWMNKHGWSKAKTVWWEHRTMLGVDQHTMFELPQWLALRVFTGLPLRSMEGGIQPNYKWKSGDLPESAWIPIDAVIIKVNTFAPQTGKSMGLMKRPLPLRPIWPGFAINTIFYAAVCWLLFAAPFAIRRRRRIKRNLCPACAYPVGTSNLCTECGNQLRPRIGACGEGLA